jgi:hypothetical protein
LATPRPPRALCRSNLSYQRYNDGRKFLQTLTSKLTDVATLGVAFDVQACHKDPTEAQHAAHQRFKNNFIHLISLMHAVALAVLRDDYDMENIIVRPSCFACDNSASRRAGGSCGARASRVWSCMHAAAAMLCSRHAARVQRDRARCNRTLIV